jgi:hypothetical protein
VFEFQLRILEAGPTSYLGIVEGFPAVMGHGPNVGAAEADVIRALSDYLSSLQDLEGTRLQLDEFPTARSARLLVGPGAS